MSLSIRRTSQFKKDYHLFTLVRTGTHADLFGK